MKKFLGCMGLGLGLAIGVGLVYGVWVSEAVRLVTVGFGGFLMAVLTVLATALAVNRQWIRSAEGSRVSHHYRYQLPEPEPGPARPQQPGVQWGYGLPPVSALPAGSENDEVIA